MGLPFPMAKVRLASESGITRPCRCYSCTTSSGASTWCGAKGAWAMRNFVSNIQRYNLFSATGKNDKAKVGIEAVGIERHGQQQKPLRLPLKDWQAEITGESEKVWVAFWLINLSHVWSCVVLSKEIPSKCNKPDRFWYRSLVSYVHICWSCQVLHRGQWCLRPPEIWHLIWESWETQRTTWLDRHQNRWILLKFPGLGRLESRSWDWSPPEDWVDLERLKL